LKQNIENGLRVTIIHPGHICGKGWIPIGPTANRNVDIFNAICQGKEIVLPDDGGATLQHVHSIDIARMIRLIIGNREAEGENFNIMCEKPITLRQYAETLYDYYGQERRIVYLKYMDFLNSLNKEDAIESREHIERSPNVSMKKAREKLGFVNQYSERDTVIEAVDSIMNLYLVLIGGQKV